MGRMGHRLHFYKMKIFLTAFFLEKKYFWLRFFLEKFFWRRFFLEKKIFLMGRGTYTETDIWVAEKISW